MNAQELQLMLCYQDSYDGIDNHARNSFNYLFMLLSQLKAKDSEFAVRICG